MAKANAQDRSARQGVATHRLSVQFLRFAVVGVIGFAVNAGLVEWLATYVGPLWAQCMAFPVAVTVTWSLNRRYTFAASEGTVTREWLRYAMANTLGWLANNGTYVWMIFNFATAYEHPAIAVAAGSLAGMLFNFWISRQFVFKRG